jgi:hypothetical protein
VVLKFGNPKFVFLVVLWPSSLDSLPTFFQNKPTSISMPVSRVVAHELKITAPKHDKHFITLVYLGVCKTVGPAHVFLAG